MAKIVGADELGMNHGYMLTWFTLISIRSQILGQVTAIYSIVESLVPIIFGPLYSAVYKNTVDTLPGAYSLIGSTLAVPATIIYLWVPNNNLFK